VELDPNIPEHDRAAAIECAKLVSDDTRGPAVGGVSVKTIETVREWFARYHKAAARGEVGRKNRGRPQAAIARRRGVFKTWIDPLIGHLPMTGSRSVGPDDIRRVVARLDNEIRIRGAFYRGKGARDEQSGKKPGLSHTTAKHVWSELTNGFREAKTSKIDRLRVREDDPTRDVQPPDGGADREQAALYSSELVKLLSCEAIPLARRRVYALAAYTGLRRGELDRLTVDDVDLEHGTVRVRGTKTDAARRRVPIEPELRPLLALLVEERKSGALLAVPRADGKGGSADLIRSDLARAELTREDLTADDETRMPFTFHGLRHTAITHWYLAGRDTKWLLIVAGHTMSEMTCRYLDAAAVARSTFGAPHPPLPASLLVSPSPEVSEASRSKRSVSSRLRRGHARAARQTTTFRDVLSTKALASIPAGVAMLHLADARRENWASTATSGSFAFVPSSAASRSAESSISNRASGSARIRSTWRRPLLPRLRGRRWPRSRPRGARSSAPWASRRRRRCS
jgi:integrase